MLTALGVLLAAAVALPTPASSPRVQVVMEVERGVPLDADDLTRIAAHVQRIWAPLLDVAVRPLSDARVALAADTVRLVITTRTLDARERTGLGWIEFLDGQPQPVMTVSTSAAARLMHGGLWRGRAIESMPPKAARLFMERALALAVAHELGHYLLRSTAHARTGLMRAAFTVDDVMDSRAVTERLDADSAARIRHAAGLVARLDAPGPDQPPAERLH